ncbi:MAG: C4-type zinc ribbon domain-containing protein [Nitrospirota bacterium]
MDEQLSMLIRLQEMDTEIRGLMNQRNRLPEILKELERRQTANKAKLDAAKESLTVAQKNKRERDQELEAGIQKVEKLRARTSEIKTNKEYQALLKEIETVEQENRAQEDTILEFMEKIDAAHAAIEEAEEASRLEEAAIAAERKEQEAAVARIDEQLKEREKQKMEITAGIEPSLLARYQRLLAAKSGTAIVEVKGESCSGCFMSIPPQVFVNVKKNEETITCPQCGRILYYKEVIVPVQE